MVISSLAWGYIARLELVANCAEASHIMCILLCTALKTAHMGMKISTDILNIVSNSKRLFGSGLIAFTCATVTNLLKIATNLLRFLASSSYCSKSTGGQYGLAYRL